MCSPVFGIIQLSGTIVMTLMIIDADADEVTNKVDPARHPHHNFRTSAKSFKQKLFKLFLFLFDINFLYTL